MIRTKRATQSLDHTKASKPTTQQLPIVIEKYYVQQAGRRKGELCWTEGKPSRSFPYRAGKTARHTKRITVDAPTTLRGVLNATARAIGQSAASTMFLFHHRGHGVCVFAFANERKAGKPAVAIVNDVVSPLGWHRDPDGMWTCLPDHMTSSRTYIGADEILSALPADAPTDGWLWEKPRKTDAERKNLLAIKTSLKIMRSKRLTLADARKINRFVEDLIRANAA